VGEKRVEPARVPSMVTRKMCRAERIVRIREREEEAKELVEEDWRWKFKNGVRMVRARVRIVWKRGVGRDRVTVEAMVALPWCSDDN
jgi:hypothetical protein